MAKRSFAHPCDTCRELRDWGSANGPDGLVERIAAMLDLVATGDFEEIHPRFLGYSRDERVPWSSARREQLHEFFPDGPYTGMPPVASTIAIRCVSCDRRFEQSWVFERGHESWTITADR